MGARHLAEGEKAAAELREFDVTPFPLDVASPEQIDTFYSYVQEK